MLPQKLTFFIIPLTLLVRTYGYQPLLVENKYIYRLITDFVQFSVKNLP